MSHKLRQNLSIGLICLVIALVNILVQIQTNRSYGALGIDSGVFAYCGEEILGGKVLYRDCYDNKPPGVYYLNALAILLMYPTPGSIWIFQTIWMGVTAAVFFLVLRKIWGLGLVALLSTALFLFTALYPTYNEGGNFTETYVLLPQILIIASLYAYLTTRRQRHLVSLGVLTACTFLLKPTYISVGFFAALVIFYVDIRSSINLTGLRRLAGHALILAASVLAPLLLVAFYWIFRGAFYDLWFAVILHNNNYVQGGFSLWLLKMTVIKLLTVEPLAFLFRIGLVTGILFLVENWRELLPGRREDPAPSGMDPQAARRWLTLAVLGSVPLEIFFITLSGKDFGHYYLLLLPALATASAYLFVDIQRWFQQKRPAALSAAAAMTLLLLVSSFWWGKEIVPQEAVQAESLVAYWQNPGIVPSGGSQQEEYIRSHSQPNQSVFIWADRPSLNFMAGRHSPTRYVFPSHILMPTPTGNTGFAELLADLEKDPPALIVAQRFSVTHLPSFWVKDDVLCPDCSAEVLAGMRSLKQYSADHYKFTLQIGNWYFFRRIR